MPNIIQYRNHYIVFLRSYRSQTSFCQSSRRAGGPYLCCRCQMKRCTRRHGTAAEAIGRTMEIIRTFGPLFFSTFSRAFATFCMLLPARYLCKPSCNRHVCCSFSSMVSVAQSHGCFSRLNAQKSLSRFRGI